jgi:NMD protein affecting ribosome stability and mRNA decay
MVANKPISNRRKHGRKWSIVKTDFNVHGVNYTSVTPNDARALYSANKDS